MEKKLVKISDYIGPASALSGTRDVKILDSLEDIQEKRAQILDRYAKFKAEAQARREKLEDSLKFQYFKRDAELLEAWIHEKLQAVTDETFTNANEVQNSIQKHQEIEAEVKGRNEAMSTLQSTGMEMVNRNHYAADLIKQFLDDVQTLWELLQAKLADKSLKLQKVLSSYSIPEC